MFSTLEKPKGWRHCHAFITFGTPFRGSINAVDYLANGYKKLFLDLTEVMRTFPSVYELMPRYEMLKVGSAWQRVAEAEKLPQGIDQKMAKDALEFHREIDAALEKNKQDPLYDYSGKWIYPVVGMRQKTLQSAEFTPNGHITAHHGLPDIINAAYDGGDGTVPKVSATPIDPSDEHRETFFVEQHASLQNNPYVLDNMIERLRQMQGKGLAQIQAVGGYDFDEATHTPPNTDEGGQGEGTGASGQPWIGLQFEDVYLRDEPAEITAEVGADPDSLVQGLEAVVRRVNTGATAPPAQYAFQEASSGWKLTLGRYKARVCTKIDGPSALNPVTAIFEIADFSGSRP